MRLVKIGTRSAAVAAAAFALAACSDHGGRYEITEKRQLAEARPEQLVPASTRERLSPPDTGMGGHGGGMGGPMERAPSPSFAADLPPGWKVLPPTQFRTLNYAIDGREKLEAYVSVTAGTVNDNLNRWRKQMGAAELSAAELAALPRVTFLGGEAALVTAEGPYKGPGMQAAEPGYALAGVAAERGGAIVTAKLIGPAEHVNAELERFKGLCASVRSAAAAGSDPHGDPHAGMDVSAGAGDGPEASPFTWKAPQGWTQGGPRQMRLVTFTPDGAEGTECYVTILGGAAGGVAANINLWRQQRKLAPLSSDAIAKLPKISVLGRDAPFAEIDGGKVGTYGVVCELGDRTVFVKMNGPMDVLRAERERFVEFCKSLSATQEAPR